jgi:ankyrin repeat protein
MPADDLRADRSTGRSAVRKAVAAAVSSRDREASALELLKFLGEAYVEGERNAGRWFALTLSQLSKHLAPPIMDRITSHQHMVDTAAHAAAASLVEQGFPALKALLASGLSPNARRSSDGLSLMHIVAAEGSPAAAAVLLKYGADLEAEAEARLTPLMFAVELNIADMVKFLLSQGADPTHCTGSGMDSLLLAIGVNKSCDKVVQLIATGIDVTAMRKNGQSPMEAAAASNNASAIRLLSEAGASVNAMSGRPAPLAIAAEAGNFEAALALVECHADTTLLSNLDLEECVSDEELTHIRSAIAENIIFRASSVPTCPEHVHNGQNEGSGSRRSPANFSPL